MTLPLCTARIETHPMDGGHAVVTTLRLDPRWYPGLPRVTECWRCGKDIEVDEHRPEHEKPLCGDCEEE